MKKSALVETQGRIFWHCNPFQVADFMLEMLVHADFCRNHPHPQGNPRPIQPENPRFYSRLVEKQWKQL